MQVLEHQKTGRNTRVQEDSNYNTTSHIPRTPYATTTDASLSQTCQADQLIQFLVLSRKFVEELFCSCWQNSCFTLETLVSSIVTGQVSLGLTREYITHISKFQRWDQKLSRIQRTLWLHNSQYSFPSNSQHNLQRPFQVLTLRRHVLRGYTLFTQIHNTISNDFSKI